MGNISDKLQYLAETKEAIKEAIKAKGVGVANADTFRSYADRIRAIPQEQREPVKKGDVTFYDYDGTILHSYTKESFLALVGMPELPTRVGLICQGWNYELETAKTYVEEYGVLDIGATYITDDGKTRLYITIAAEGRMDVPIYFQQTVAYGVVVDWGDGSATTTFSGTTVNATHHYESIGDYVITLEVTSGELKIVGSSSQCLMGYSNNHAYTNMLRRVEIGNGTTGIGLQAFYSCNSLTSVVIPNSVTSIGGSAFYSCYSLTSVVIPNSVTSIGGSAFNNCRSLTSVVIPNSVTSIGGSAFYDCSSLTPVVIPNSVTSIGSNTFKNCYSLTSVVIPNSVTSIGDSGFYYCHSLTSVVIPNSVTRIGSNAFTYCHSLTSVVIPNSVTSIGGSAFYSCNSVAFYDFSSHESVPTLGNTNAFSRNASDCKIIVPDSLYDEWIAASYWSNYASQIVKASEYNG